MLEEEDAKHTIELLLSAVLKLPTSNQTRLYGFGLCFSFKNHIIYNIIGLPYTLYTFLVSQLLSLEWITLAYKKRQGNFNTNLFTKLSQTFTFQYLPLKTYMSLTILKTII